MKRRNIIILAITILFITSFMNAFFYYHYTKQFIDMGNYYYTTRNFIIYYQVSLAIINPLSISSLGTLLLLNKGIPKSSPQKISFYSVYTVIVGTIISTAILVLTHRVYTVNFEIGILLLFIYTILIIALIVSFVLHLRIIDKHTQYSWIYKATFLLIIVSYLLLAILNITVHFSREIFETYGISGVTIKTNFVNQAIFMPLQAVVIALFGVIIAKNKK